MTVVASVGLVGAAAPSVSAEPRTPRAPNVALTVNKGWTATFDYSKSISRCVQSDVMVGFKHDGNDEHAATSIRCGYLADTATGGRVIHDAWSKSAWIKESSNVTFTCPVDRALYQRMHFNDENGTTQYRCATLKLYNTKEDGGIVRIRLGDVAWEPWFNERRSEFVCPTHKVITGRQHTGDVESGRSRYRCSQVVGVAS